MKPISQIALLVLITIIMSLPVQLLGQSVQTLGLEITYNKTTTVVFPDIVKSVDRGSRDVLAQKVKGVENVIQLKAARTNFNETNVTVITANGSIHHLTVNYATEPGNLVLNISTQDSVKSSIIFPVEMTEPEMDRYARKIKNKKHKGSRIKQHKYDINLSLQGVYIRNNVIFYHFQIRNSSNINYDIDFLRFYIKDQVKMKRTASQEIAISPLFIHGNDKIVPGNSKTDLVYALEKFTIPDAKRLLIEMFEKNGGRHLELSIKNKTIMKAQLLR